jgi:4-alpha-glucanotransferase
LPVFSLPSPYGIGTLGKAAFDFVDFLAGSGQSMWQILPMGPTGASGSPYQSLSAFAGNPYHVDLDLLERDGLLTKRDLKPIRDAVADNMRVNYLIQAELRMPLLMKAASRFVPDADYRKFRRGNAWWLDDFSRGASAVSIIQYFFQLQWQRLKRYANARGVGVVGDLPFYIGAESADYKAHPELFEVDAEGSPRLIAGVPPDAFAQDGQIWNDPVYDWKEHARTGYDWWIRRFIQADVMYDFCRVDHFRAFAAYFAIPAGRPASEGEWVPGPGKKFIDAVKKSVPALGVIAEDLGIITEDVHALREYSGYPGMRVLQFAFAPGKDSSYLPHNHVKDCVCYTGTHDNPTLREWSDKLPKHESDFARVYLGTDRKGLSEAMLRAALGSVADVVIVPLQDYMGLGARARINTPSTVSRKNWTWRLAPGDLTAGLSGRILDLTRMYGRAD